MNKNNIKINTKGFTLIELMVATSLFVIIMLSALGSLFMLLDEAKNSRALRFAMDNVNFAMESMTRSIRMGTNYYCVDEGQTMPTNLIDFQDCSGEGGTLLAFVSQPDDNGDSERVGYRLGTLEINGVSRGTLEKCVDSNCIPIVSSDVDVETLKFFVTGSDPQDTIQPSVYLMMKGTIKVKGKPVSFAVQTMASQRNY